jgi:hypothetical protein
MTVEAGAAGPRVGPAVDAALNLKTGGICLIVGAVVFTIWRLLHGDTPAADAEAALNFVQNRPLYPTVHVFAVLAGLIVVIGLLALARSFDRPGSWFGSSPGSTRTTSARTSPYWISSQRREQQRRHARSDLVGVDAVQERLHRAHPRFPQAGTHPGKPEHRRLRPDRRRVRADRRRAGEKWRSMKPH